MIKIISLFFVSLLVTAQVCAEQTNNRSRSPLLKMLTQLDLSEQQKREIKLYAKDKYKQRVTFRTDDKPIKAALRDIIQAESWDEPAAIKTLVMNADTKQKLLNSRALTHHKIWLLLNSAQQQQLSQMIAVRGNREIIHQRTKIKRQNRWNRIAKELKLSREQSRKIEVFQQDFEQQRRLFTDHQNEYKIAERNIIKATKFNQLAWQDLYSEYERAMIDLALAAAHMQHQIINVLNESQKTKFEKHYRRLKPTFSVTSCIDDIVG